MHAIAHCIPRFERTGPTATLAPASPAPQPFGRVPAIEAPTHAADRAGEIDALIAAAEARGYAAGRAEADAVLEAQRARHEQERDALFANARSAWAREEGARLAEQLAAAQETATQRLAEAVARTLAPILEQRLHQSTVDDFVATVRELMTHPDATALEITGPADLLAAFRAALGPAGERLRFIENDCPEARASMADSVVETRLALWRDRLRAAIG